MQRLLWCPRRLALLLFAAVTLPGATSAASAPTRLPAVTPAAAISRAAEGLPRSSAVSLIAASTPATSVPFILDTAQIVSIYGYPGAPAMGILGTFDAEGAAREAEHLAAAWQALPGARRTVGALHLITDVAQPQPMADGSYLARMSSDEIAMYVNAARRHGLLLFLDIQVGGSNALTEVRALAPFLALPFVHVALDPEFAMHDKGGVPGTRIGSLGAQDVNAVQTFLASVVAHYNLPPKVLMLHQFRADMLTHTEAYADVPQVVRVIDMDGWGGDQLKLANYETFSLAPYAMRAAIKLFYKWDVPLLTPDRLLALPHVPDIVIYQ